MRDRPADDTRPRYSIVIPAYNEAFYLRECLASLAAQTCPAPFEVIVVDNNSTDETAAIAQAAGVTVVYEPIPGVCQARQRGTELARGEIVVSADADTNYHPDWLSRIDAWFDGDPALIAVGGPCYFRDGPEWGRTVQRLLFGGVRAISRIGGPVLYISATNFAFRNDAWTGYDTRLAQGGDELDLLRRLRKKGRVAFDPANPSHTSGRRMNKGALYNFTVSFFYYYILGYALNRLFGRPVLGRQPAFRYPAAQQHESALDVDPPRDWPEESPESEARTAAQDPDQPRL